MALLRARNADITEGRQETFLSAACASGAGTLTVSDISGFSVGQYLVLGKWGEEETEIVRIHTSTAPSGTTITLNANTAYAHGVTTPVTMTPFNQVEFSRATTTTGSKSVLATSSISADEEFTIYDDTSNTTGYGFIRFKNSASGLFSSYSGAVSYGGYATNSLFSILKLGRELANDTTQDFVKDKELIVYLNHKQRDIATTYKPFETSASTSSVANQAEYTLPSDIYLPRSVTYRTYPLAPIPLARYEELVVRDRPTSDTPRFAVYWGTTFKIWPNSASSAQTTALNGAVTSTDTTFTVDSTSGLNATGRFIVDSEVIGYTGTTTTTLTGCTRGLEDTTAASHLDNAVVTARDIVTAYYYVPADLADYTDTTDLKDAEIYAFAVAEYIETKRANQNRAAYWNALYKERLGQLRDRYVEKQTYGFYSTRAQEDVVRDQGRFYDPNIPPHGLTGV